MFYRLEDYIIFLKKSKNRGFTFYRVKDSKDIKTTEHNIILRHDVDLSLEYALEMAKIEATEDIYATYYVMVDGQFYNVLEARNIDCLKQIKALGHEIGLHFDTRNYPNIEHQLKILEAIIEAKVFSVAQHAPVNNGFVQMNIPHIIDAYTLTNSVPHLEYISDSGMMWRRYTFEEGLNLEKNLYLLAHPISWLNPKNDLISIIKEMKSLDIECRKQSFDQFIESQYAYYQIRKNFLDK